MGKTEDRDKLILDISSLIDNTSEHEMVSRGDVENNGGGDDVQKNSEAEMSSLDSRNDASAEQDGSFGGDIETAEHIKENVEQHSAAVLEKFKRKSDLYEQALEELANENNAKIAANGRYKQALQDINESK